MANVVINDKDKRAEYSVIPVTKAVADKLGSFGINNFYLSGKLLLIGIDNLTFLNENNSSFLFIDRKNGDSIYISFKFSDNILTIVDISSGIDDHLLDNISDMDFVFERTDKGFKSTL